MIDLKYTAKEIADSLDVHLSDVDKETIVNLLYEVWDDGYADGEQDGYNDGHQAGYDAGLDDCEADNV